MASHLRTSRWHISCIDPARTLD